MINRRLLLRQAMVAVASTPVLTSAARAASPLVSSTLQQTWIDSDHKARLPVGATLRVVAESSKPVTGTSYYWHGAPDGGACFASEDGGWIYVSNSEMPDDKGGASALKFDAEGQVVDAYRILGGTTRNCAGGRSLWSTWLSCEENDDEGLVHECDPTGGRAAQVLPALGAFNHEAVVFDPETGRAYLTEDMRDGCLYRFSPAKPGNLTAGLLEVAVLTTSGVDWAEVPDPSARRRSTRKQVKDAAHFKGGEGLAYADGVVYFTTKLDNRVWALSLGRGDTEQDQLRVVYDAKTAATPILSGVDNLEICPSGELLVAEDGGDMQIVALDLDGNPAPLVTLFDQRASEITGPAFSPDGTRLYFSSQRGYSGESEDGITYELSLPDHFFVNS